MPTDPLLTLSQWLSPSFPVSAYAYSHGLEAAVTAGAVTNAAQCGDWIAGVLAHGAGRNDAILLLRARAGEDAAALAARARALAGSAERWEETRALGAAFSATLLAMGQAVPQGLPYPVALGVAARELDLPPDLVARLYLQAFVASLVSAAVRLVPLGQAAGQGVITDLQPLVETVAEDAAASGLDDLGGAAFGADLAAMRHETQEVRLFRT